MVVEHWPGAALTTTGAWQVIWYTPVPLTVTDWSQEMETFPAASVATHVMSVTPNGYGSVSNNPPGLVPVIVCIVPQLSVAVAVPIVDGGITAEQTASFTVTFGGQLTIGRSVSFTVIVKLQVAVCAWASVTV